MDITNQLDEFVDEWDQRRRIAAQLVAYLDCIGTLDETHVRVKVSTIDALRYRGRKDYPTQNVLAACSFDLRFTYILPSWEGTTSDSRLIKNALTREDNLQIPEGKYYLVDAGYMLKGSLLPPCRSIRYHLKEYSTRTPENTRELFDMHPCAMLSRDVLVY
ncbi:hypothetical protein L1049_002831 [Liquidambar formosana]|uniref:DDE Tnp4 domain-containing protein n=1 Tax=Liquidambar formosana TaxID=63359 RepID=A0AAP0R960_LIQFO